jgi:hypothetical protein
MKYIAVPCKPHRREVYDIVHDVAVAKEINAFLVAILDEKPLGLQSLELSSGEFLVIAPVAIA